MPVMNITGLCFPLKPQKENLLLIIADIKLLFFDVYSQG